EGLERRVPSDERVEQLRDAFLWQRIPNSNVVVLAFPGVPILGPIVDKHQHARGRQVLDQSIQDGLALAVQPVQVLHDQQQRLDPTLADPHAPDRVARSHRTGRSLRMYAEKQWMCRGVARRFCRAAMSLQGSQTTFKGALREGGEHACVRHDAMRRDPMKANAMRNRMVLTLTVGIVVAVWAARPAGSQTGPTPRSQVAGGQALK